MQVDQVIFDAPVTNGLTPSDHDLPSCAMFFPDEPTPNEPSTASGNRQGTTQTSGRDATAAQVYEDPEPPSSEDQAVVMVTTSYDIMTLLESREEGADTRFPNAIDEMHPTCSGCFIV